MGEGFYVVIVRGGVVDRKGEKEEREGVIENEEDVGDEVIE